MDRRSALTLALKWAGQGWAAIPVAIRPAGTPGVTHKRPAHHDGHHAATTDPDQLEQLFTAADLHPGEDLAVGVIPATAGCVVLDYDIKHGALGGQVLAQHLATHPDLAACSYTSASGGTNVILTKPDRTVSINNVKCWSGVDVRADAGWIVAPGSTTRYGHWDFVERSAPPSSATTVPGPLWAVLVAAATSNGQRGRRATRRQVDAWQRVRTAWTPGARAYVDQQLAELAAATPGDRHPTLMSVIGRIVPLDNIHGLEAMTEVRAAWHTLTSGDPERAGEVDDVLAWIVGQEVHRAKTGNTSGNTSTGDTVPDEDLPSGPQPINWVEFFSTDHTTGEWLCEPLVAKNRQHALVAPAKAGKSLLAKEVAIGVATGRPCLAKPATTPVDVVYIDQEMTADDLAERLTAFAVTDPADLEHLHYYQLQTFPPLDTADGARALLDVVERHGATLVILDTVARVVAGEEDSADTYRNFFRYTGTALKAAGITLLRLDHLGKDATRGARGSSAKNDDVDVVWQMTADGRNVRLRATHRRINWVPDHVDLRRLDDPLRHEVTGSADFARDRVRELAAHLDRLGVPLDASRQDAMQALRDDGVQCRTIDVGEALKWRRQQVGMDPS